ncbi:MAG: hypothetical protein CMK07_03080 [Ponticaulis sp.]|nr:hypothetical protein [Ponticaulis sp.]
MPEKIIGAVYAGGRARRLGGIDKAALEVQGNPLHQMVIPKISDVVDDVILLSSTAPDWLNRHPDVNLVDDYLPTGEPVGPAGGLLAALDYALTSYGPNTKLVTTPIDAPFFPSECLTALVALLESGATASVLSIAGRLQPAFSAWQASELDNVVRFVKEGDLALHVLAKRAGALTLDYDAPEELFLNINTQDDLAQAEALFGN